MAVVDILCFDCYSCNEGSGKESFGDWHFGIENFVVFKECDEKSGVTSGV